MAHTAVKQGTLLMETLSWVLAMAWSAPIVPQALPIVCFMKYAPSGTAYPSFFSLASSASQAQKLTWCSNQHKNKGLRKFASMMASN